MGIHGRDWMREGGGRSPPGAGLSATTWLILVNAVLWFVYAGAFRQGGLYGAAYRFITDTLLLHTDEVFARGRLWQPLTAIFFHDPGRLDHVLFNLLFLWFFGRVVEGIVDRRTFYLLYLGGGVASALALVPVAAFQGRAAVGLGASGAVYALGVFAALRLPRLPVVLLVVPMPLWVMVGVFMVGREVANLLLVGHGMGATVAHLTGGAFGWLVHRVRWARAPGQGADLLAGLRRHVRERASARRAVDEAEVRERVDRLLAKIHAEGIGALTVEEKDFLEEASRRFAGR